MRSRPPGSQQTLRKSGLTDTEGPAFETDVAGMLVCADARARPGSHELVEGRDALSTNKFMACHNNK